MIVCLLLAGASSAAQDDAVAASLTAGPMSSASEFTTSALSTPGPTIDGRLTSTASTSSSVPEPASRRVEPLATIALAAHVDGGLITDDAVWASVGESDTLYRIDPATNEVVQEVSAPGLTFRFDIGLGAAWVPDFNASVVRRVDLVSGAVVAEIPTGRNPEGIAVTESAVWLADHRAGTVTRIDPGTNAVVATIEVGPPGSSGPQSIVAAGDRIWVGVPNLGQVIGIDAVTDAVVARIDSSATCGEIAMFDDTVWITNCFETDTVTAIDTGTGISRGTVDAGGYAGTPLQIDNLVWVSTVQPREGQPGHVVGIDPTTLRIVDSITVDRPAYIAGQGFDSVWQFSWEAGSVIRLPLDAFRSSSSTTPDSGGS